MKIAVIGTGRMGTALARTLSRHIAPVIWGTRDPAALGGRIEAEGVGAVAASSEAAVSAADLVIPTLWFRDLLPWLERVLPALEGKIVVDVSNPFNANFDGFTLPPDTSAAEEVQRALPGISVVGAFKNTFWKVFDDPLRDGGASDVLVTGNDEGARREVIERFRPLPFRFLDAGTLSNNRTVERMTLLSREIALREGHYPVVSWRLWGGSR
jgi:predicted dinucleotide-binding enzyme